MSDQEPVLTLVAYEQVQRVERIVADYEHILGSGRASDILELGVIVRSLLRQREMQKAKS